MTKTIEQIANEPLGKVLRLGEPYNLKTILKDLIFATNYLLHEKNYDGHNYEELNQSVNFGNDLMNSIDDIIRKELGK